MKKILLTMVAMLCCFGMLACGGQDVNTDPAGTEDKEAVGDVVEGSGDVTEQSGAAEEETGNVEETGDAEEETGDVTPEVEEPVEEEPVAAEPTINPNSPALLGEVKIDEVLYQFPMSYAEFMAMDSWTTEEDVTAQLKARDYDSIWVAKGEAEYSVEIYNGTGEALAMEQCSVTGIGMRWMDYDAAIYSNVVLPGEIKLGTATKEEILAAYGAPCYEVEKQLQYVPEGERLFVKGSFLDVRDNVLQGIMVKNRGE